MAAENERPQAVVVGTGFGLFTHVRALRDAGFEVRAIMGRNRERTEQRAAPLGIPLVATSLAEVFEKAPDVQLVTVATPPHAHYPFVMEAIAAGRHVVCEKPFAKDFAQACEMLEAAEKAGIVHMLGAEFRFDTQQALLRRVVQDGLIGEPTYFMRIYHQPGLSDPNEKLSDWWEDAEQGGGFLGAFGAHMVDQVRHVMGEFKRVSGTLQKMCPGRPNMTSDDAYSIQFELESGAEGVIVAAMASPGQIIMGNKITGTEGGAWIQPGATFADPAEVWVQNKDGIRRIDPPADLINPPPVPFEHEELIQTEQDRWHTQGFDVAPYTRLFKEMKQRMAGQPVENRETAGDFRDAANGQAVLDAVRLSARERRWVDVQKA